MAAKGNIVVGDYTTDAFKSTVLPLLRPESGSVTQPYVIDPTDIALGYCNATAQCDTSRPVFNGNYDQLDGGKKLDDQPRKFYESSLADRDFSKLVDLHFHSRDWNPSLMDINAVLFTNHALAGFVDLDEFRINGTMISRDDALVFDKDLFLNHDIRLLDDRSRLIGLPYGLQAPKLHSWTECPSSGCPSEK